MRWLSPAPTGTTTASPVSTSMRRTMARTSSARDCTGLGLTFHSHAARSSSGLPSSPRKRNSQPARQAAM